MHLTSKIALEFVVKPDRVRLDHFTTLEDAAAVILADSPEDLVLPKVETLSDTSAAALAHHRGQLSLTGLRGLSISGAHALANHADLLLSAKLAAFIWLEASAIINRRGQVLTKAIAEEMVCSGNCPGELGLKEYFNLAEDAAEVLLRYEGELWLDGITGFSSTAAETIAKHRHDVFVDGLRELKETPGEIALAGKLSQRDPALSIQLNKLSILGCTPASILVLYRGHLSLNGLTSLTEELAAILAKSCCSINLDGVEDASDEAINLLATSRQVLSLPFELDRRVFQRKLARQNEILADVGGTPLLTNRLSRNPDGKGLATASGVSKESQRR
jgi:hypothetical protein